MTGPDPALRRAILDLLDQRAEGATRQGAAVDPATAKGPIRIRRTP